MLEQNQPPHCCINMQEVATSCSISEGSRWRHCVPPSPRLEFSYKQRREEYQTESSVCQILLRIDDALAPALPSHRSRRWRTSLCENCSTKHSHSFTSRVVLTHPPQIPTPSELPSLGPHNDATSSLQSSTNHLHSSLIPLILQCYYSNSIMQTGS